MRLTIGSDIVMDFAHDHNGQPYAVKYNGTTYYYVLNLQGDVVKIVTAAGNSCGTYTYDAWGNVLYASSGNLMTYNPLRYRGYVYDTETELYYLQSRYYDPEVGRFINADSFASTGQGILGNNMFAYCNNNPVSRLDYEGDFFCTIIGTFAGAISGGLWGWFEGKSGTDLEATILSNASSGFVSGFVSDILLFTGATTTVAVIVLSCAGAGGTVIGNLVEANISGKEKSPQEFWTDVAWGAGFGAFFGYMGGEIPSQIPTMMDYGYSYVAYQLFEEGEANFGINLIKETFSNFMTSLTRASAEVYSYIVETLVD